MALIYIVEDDSSIREIETIALKNSNYMVCAFEKAKDFYKKLDEITPDLVLLDIMLPDENGYDILKKLRNNPGDEAAAHHYGDSENNGDGYDPRPGRGGRMIISRSRSPLWN